MRIGAGKQVGRLQARRRRAATAALALGALVSCLAAGACSRGPAVEAAAHAASSPAAQRELRAIEAEWEVGSSIRRQALRPRLERFLANFAKDPSAGRARVLLARIAVMEGRLGAAEEILGPVLLGSPNRVQDEATVVLASVRNRQKRPDEALELLEPLDGKLLTVEARYEYSQEKARAALADRRWRLLVDTMTSWIAQAAHLDSEAKDWCKRALKQVPSPALSRLLADWNRGEVPPEEEQARAFIQREIIDQLSVQALTKKDARLARELLRLAPPWLRASDMGDELSLLAALAEEEARVSGRLVGMVLGGPQRGQRARSVRAGVGLMRRLGLDEGALGAPSGVSMIAEEHRGSIRTALSALSGNGAAVLVAAVDPVSAMEALAFAESRRVPVVVLAPPMGVEQLNLSYGFSIGVSDAEQQAAMGAGLGSSAAFVGSTKTPCPGGRLRPGTTSLPLDDWRTEGISTVAILGDPACARRVILETEAEGGGFDIALGLEAAATILPRLARDRSYSFLRAGDYPTLTWGDHQDDYVEGEGRRSDLPSDWFETLGSDLAALLEVALLELPESVTSEPQEVRRLHDRARDALLSAEASLRTTESRGFLGDHRMKRTLSLVSAEASR